MICHSRDTTCPDFAKNHAPRKTEGAGNAGRLKRARSLVCNIKKAHELLVTTGSLDNAGIPCTNGLTAYSTFSPETGLIVSVVEQNSVHSTWRQHRGVRTAWLRRTRRASFVLRYRRAHRIPRPTSVTIAIRPSCGGGTARIMRVIWHCDQCGARAADWHDGQIRCVTRNRVKCKATAASFVIARSESDEAIQNLSAAWLDCFASLAKTEGRPLDPIIPGRRDSGELWCAPE
jgi:hypothetical protein